jgi:hypothetical protein
MNCQQKKPGAMRHLAWVLGKETGVSPAQPLRAVSPRGFLGKVPLTGCQQMPNRLNHHILNKVAA